MGFADEVNHYAGTGYDDGCEVEWPAPVLLVRDVLIPRVCYGRVGIYQSSEMET